MKILLDSWKKIKEIKRTTIEGGAPQTKKVITKKPRVALGGPPTSAKALELHPLRVPTAKDDNEVEIILASIPVVLISSSAMAPLAMSPTKPSSLVQVEAKRKSKAPMTSSEPKKTPQDEEYIHIEAEVRNTTSALKSKGLAEKLVKMILLPQD